MAKSFTINVQEQRRLGGVTAAGIVHDGRTPAFSAARLGSEATKALLAIMLERHCRTIIQHNAEIAR